MYAVFYSFQRLTLFLSSKNLLHTWKGKVVSVSLLSSPLPLSILLIKKHGYLSGVHIGSSLLLLINELEAGERKLASKQEGCGISLINSPSVSWRGIKGREGTRKEKD